MLVQFQQSVKYAKFLFSVMVELVYTFDLGSNASSVNVQVVLTEFKRK